MNDHLSIVHINTNDLSGGAAKVAWRLAEGQRSDGHDSRLLVGSREGNSPYSVSFPVEADPLLRQQCVSEGLLYYEFRGSNRLVSHPMVQKADILHLHNLHGDYFNPFSLVPLSRAKPVVWTLHDMQALTGHCAHSLECRRWISGCGSCPDLGIYPSIAKDATSLLWQDKKHIYESSAVRIIVPSQWLKNKVKQSILGNHQVELIYNGVDTRLFRPRNKSALRQKYGLSEQVNIVGCVAAGGVANPWKGGAYAVDIVRSIAASNRNCVFLNVGSGSSLGIPSIVDIPYVHDESELIDLYSLMDVFLYNSLADNCPLVILEAMACGVPIVSFETGGVPELVRNHHDGYIVGYKDSGAAVEALATLLAHPDKTAALAASARQRAVSAFDQRHITAAYEKSYRQALESCDASAGPDVRATTHAVRRGAGTPANKDAANPGHTADGRQGTAGYLVSAIVSTYKSERFMRGCLEDLVSQTLYRRGELEIIVVDSASPENEGAVVAEFQSRYPHIKYLRTAARESVYAAWNRGIRAASGGFVTNANTDDRHRPDAFEIMAQALRTNPDVAAVYADVAITPVENETFENTTARICFTWPDFSLRQLLRGNFFGPQPMWRRSIHHSVGYFDEELVVAGDYDFALRVAWKGGALHIREVLGLYLQAPASVEHANRDQSNSEALSLLRHYRTAIPLEEIYPGLRTNNSPEAQAAVCIDMGNCCLLSDFPDLQLAATFYTSAAAHIGIVPEIEHNLSVISRLSNGDLALVPEISCHLKRRDHPVLETGKTGAALELHPEIRRTTNRVDFNGVGQYIHSYAPLSRASCSAKGHTGLRTGSFRVIAMISAHNEGDIIYHVIGDLIRQGVEVYLLDHCSTDNTVAEASRWLGKGLLHIENFPKDAGYPEANEKQYIWSQILKRKEELAAQLDADWFIHSDADEFRESPWPGLTLAEAIRVVDAQGYSALDFELLNFRPVNNDFVPGGDVRQALRHYEPCEDFNALQVKAWKNPRQPVRIVDNGGHDISFDGRRVYPVKFILRHYPIRSQSHGLRKVFAERKRRFNSIEREVGWHVQYDHIASEEHNFLHDPASLPVYDGDAARLRVLSREAMAMAAGFAKPCRETPTGRPAKEPHPTPRLAGSTRLREALRPYGTGYRGRPAAVSQAAGSRVHPPLR